MTNQQQIQNYATKIQAAGDTYATYLYAIQDKNGLIVRHRNNTHYATRSEARAVRRSLQRNDVKVVRAEFINVSRWETAK